MNWESEGVGILRKGKDKGSGPRKSMSFKEWRVFIVSRMWGRWENCGQRLQQTPHNEEFWGHFKEYEPHLEDKNEIFKVLKLGLTWSDLHFSKILLFILFFFPNICKICVIEYIKIDRMFKSDYTVEKFGNSSISSNKRYINHKS